MPFGITLSGYMAEKYQSVGVKRVYLFQLIGLSVLSTGVQLLALPLFSVVSGRQEAIPCSGDWLDMMERMALSFLRPDWMCF